MIKIAKFKFNKNKSMILFCSSLWDTCSYLAEHQCSTGLGNNAMKACWGAILDGGNKWPA